MLYLYQTKNALSLIANSRFIFHSSLVTHTSIILAVSDAPCQATDSISNSLGGFLHCIFGTLSTSLSCTNLDRFFNFAPPPVSSMFEPNLAILSGCPTLALTMLK
eukprot:NODE_108_length_19701_cov_0.369452.p16 type:complete len:105 gc:universal NODE_108_length_19701_cov_0.369452:14845-14531(-)